MKTKYYCKIKRIRECKFVRGFITQKPPFKRNLIVIGNCKRKKGQTVGQLEGKLTEQIQENETRGTLLGAPPFFSMEQCI